MRRTLPLLLIAALGLAACSSDDDANADTEATEATEQADGGDTDDTSPADDASADETSTPPTNPDKPEVQLPDGAPEQLQITYLENGSGPEAEAGDTVIVDYIGVRSSDGVEFDNSYDRFEPFPVVLGKGDVIQGWDDGLVDAQTGDRIQLDIPSELAYGAEARSDVIRENEDLTFVIDVRAVIEPPNAEDAPTEAGVPESDGAADTSFVDLVEGDGPELQPGQTGVLNYVLFRGDNLVVLDSSWELEPIQLGTAEGNMPGFVEGLPGMKVGGRRAIIIPPEDGFGEEGNPQLGLPAATDMIIVVDLLGVYGTPTG